MNRRDFIKTAAVAAGCAAGLPIAAEMGPELVSSMPLDTKLVKAVFQPAPYEGMTTISVAGQFRIGDMIEIRNALEAHKANGKYRITSADLGSSTYNVSHI